MNLISWILAVALCVVLAHDIYQGKLLDKLATKYHVSQTSLKNVMKVLAAGNT